MDLAPLTRVMPTAGSGAGSPSSAASTASFRTAAIRTFMPTGPRPRASRTIRTIRHALTVTFRVPLGPETALPCLGNLGGARVWRSSADGELKLATAR